MEFLPFHTLPAYKRFITLLHLAVITPPLLKSSEPHQSSRRRSFFGAAAADRFARPQEKVVPAFRLSAAALKTWQAPRSHLLGVAGAPC